MSKTVEITDFSSPALDVYARLTENQLVSRADPANAMFIAESPLVIGRALDAGYEPVSVLMEARHGNGAGAEILARLGADVPVFTAPDSVLVNLTGFHLTRGMLCCMRRRALPPAEALCRDARRVAVLENVMNPTNIGAIFRSAAALGMDAVLLTEAAYVIAWFLAYGPLPALATASNLLGFLRLVARAWGILSLYKAQAADPTR